MTKMWTNVLTLTLIAAVSSRIVEYDEDAVTLKADNVFEQKNNDTQDGVNANANEYVYDASESRRLEIVDSSRYRQITTERTKQHARQSLKQPKNHGQRNRNVGHAYRGSETIKVMTKIPEENDGDSSSVNTQRPRVNSRGMQYNTITKTHRYSTNTNPVTENVTKSIQPLTTSASTETTALKYTNADKRLTEASKDQNLTNIKATTAENEVSTTKTSTVANIGEDKLISDSSTTKKTTIQVGLDDRNIFDVDDCPTGMVKFGMKCIEED